MTATDAGIMTSDEYLTANTKANLTWKALNGSTQWFGTCGTDLTKGELTWITKTPHDMTNASMQVTFVVTSIQDGKPVAFLVGKAGFGVTTVTLYNFNTNEEKLITSIPNTQNQASFSSTSTTITQGGPLSHSTRTSRTIRRISI